MTPGPATYRRHRFAAEVISHAARLHHVFSLGLRDAELILAERRIEASHDSIRRWCLSSRIDEEAWIESQCHRFAHREPASEL